MTVTNYVGKALEVVKTLPDSSVDLVATSPPFLDVRNYNDIEGQWGSEDTPAEFLDNLLELATELRRVLTPHGSLAFEIGDKFSGSGGPGGDYNEGGMRDGQPRFSKPDYSAAWPLPKSLCLTPSLFAASLAYGRNLLNPAHEFDRWRIRNLISWTRNNPPVGALGDKVRPATSYITVACVSGSRWFDLDAVRVPAQGQGDRRTNGPKANGREANRIDGAGRYSMRIDSNPAGAPPLDHWHDEYDGDTEWLINAAGSSLAHYAMWPAKLAERLILSMCPAEVCRECGEPRRRITSRHYVDRNGKTFAGGKSFVDHSRGEITGRRMVAGVPHLSSSVDTTGWSDCGHDNYRTGVVLDPFFGTGTTGAVADMHGRNAIGIDIDPTNRQLHSARYDECKRALFDIRPPIKGQMELI